jgi:hypothetical protein
MLHRTIVWFLRAGHTAGAVFAAEPKGLALFRSSPFPRPWVREAKFGEARDWGSRIC